MPIDLTQQPKLVGACGLCGGQVMESPDGSRMEEHTNLCELARDLKARVEELEKRAEKQGERIHGLSIALGVVEDKLGILGS